MLVEAFPCPPEYQHRVWAERIRRQFRDNVGCLITGWHASAWSVKGYRTKSSKTTKLSCLNALPIRWMYVQVRSMNLVIVNRCLKWRSERHALVPNQTSWTPIEWKAQHVLRHHPKITGRFTFSWNRRMLAQLTPILHLWRTYQAWMPFQSKGTLACNVGEGKIGNANISIFQMIGAIANTFFLSSF